MSDERAPSRYMAPEAALAQRRRTREAWAGVGTAADVWALAVAVAETLHGAPLPDLDYVACSSVAECEAHVLRARVTVERARLPPKVAPLILQCLSAAAARPSMRNFVTGLENVMGDLLAAQQRVDSSEWRRACDAE